MNEYLKKLHRIYKNVMKEKKIYENMNSYEKFKC